MADLDPAANCTLDMFSTAKRLPVEFLAKMGLTDVPNPWRPSKVALRFPYQQANGTSYRGRLRLALVAKKGNTKFAWEPQRDPGPMILYGLEHLEEGRATGKPLFLVEGESDCLTMLFRGYRALGLPGATIFNPSTSDAYIEAEKQIYAVVEPGDSGRALVRTLSRSAHRDRILLISLGPVKDPSDLHVLDGDNFDAVMGAAMKAGVPLNAYVETQPDLDGLVAPHARWLPKTFRYDAVGNIEFLSVSVDGGKRVETWRRLCSHIELVDICRDGDGTSWSRRFRVRQLDGKERLVTIKMAWLAGYGDELRRHLLEHGARLEPSKEARTKLLELMTRATVPALTQIAVRLGWNDGRFLLPEQVYGAKGETYIFGPATAVPHRFYRQRSFTAWKTDIAALAVGNSRLAMAISLAFAGPLLLPLSHEGGGINLFGTTSTGKTSVAMAAGSVWGGGGPSGYASSWRATANGLEGLAAVHCDGFVVLDELSQIEPHEAAKAIYTLPNGHGKHRAGRSGEARRPAEWRVMMLSTAELTIAEKLQEGRIRVRGGQEVRLLDVPADAGKGLGVFEELHGFDNPGAFADHLKVASTTHYGHAIDAFLDRLVKDSKAIPRVRLMIDRFVADHCPSNANSQVRRAYGRFGLIAAAGELATEYNVLPWPKGEATRGVVQCAAAWLSDRGGSLGSEQLRGRRNVADFMAANEVGRFVPWKDRGARVNNRAGFIRMEDGRKEFLFHRKAFEEACGGINYRIVARELIRLGVMRHNSGRLTLKVKLSESSDGERTSGGRDFYVVTDGIFEDHGAGA